MTFQEWLPITKRNRVALCLASLSLVMFVVWNCIPVEEDNLGEPEIAGTVIWPAILSPGPYVNAFGSSDVRDYIEIAANIALIQAGLIYQCASAFVKTGATAESDSSAPKVHPIAAWGIAP